METSRPKGILMHGDVVPVVSKRRRGVAKEPGVRPSFLSFVGSVVVSVSFAVGLLALFVFGMKSCITYTRFVQSSDGSGFISSDRTEDLSEQKQLTLNDLAVAPDPMSDGCVVPDAWWDDYRTVGGYRDSGYRYVRFSPYAYKALRAQSGMGDRTLSAPAQLLLNERREKAHEASAPPEVK